MSASRPLIRLRDNPRRRRELLCFFLLPHSTWNISTHPGISRFTECLFGWNPARFLSTERRKYTIFMWFDEYILMLTVFEQVWEGKFFLQRKKQIYFRKRTNNNSSNFLKFLRAISSKFFLTNTVKQSFLLQIWSRETKLLLFICEKRFIYGFGEIREANLRKGIQFRSFSRASYRAYAEYRTLQNWGAVTAKKLVESESSKSTFPCSRHEKDREW